MKKMVTVLDHSLYSSDLSPPYYFLFRKIKMRLQGQKFSNIETNVTTELNAISQEEIL